MTEGEIAVTSKEELHAAPLSGKRLLALWNAKIPRDIYDSAEIDGATGIRRFVHVTFSLLANLYLLCTLLSILWTVGDFTTVYLVSGGGPAGLTDVLATLGFHYAFDTSRPALGVAAALSALPVLIPIAIVLMRRLQTSGVEL
jgi:multiple sugar transport system permease protein